MNMRLFVSGELIQGWIVLLEFCKSCGGQPGSKVSVLGRQQVSAALGQCIRRPAHGPSQAAAMGSAQHHCSGSWRFRPLLCHRSVPAALPLCRTW